MENALAVRSELDEIRQLDAGTGSEEQDIYLCRRTASVWEYVHSGEETSFLAKAQLIHGLKTTKLSTGLPKWRMVSLGDSLVPAATWNEYCLAHLNMHPSTASSYKRIWEVFSEKMGYRFDDLLRAGKSKLAAALKVANNMWPARHARLERALFGAPRECSSCGKSVIFEGGQPPLACPHCGVLWEAVAPETYAAVLMLLESIKEEQKGEEKEEGGCVEVSYEVEESVLREIAWWVMGEERYPLPVRIINVLEEDVVGEGLPMQQAAAYMDFMTRKHG